MTPQSRLEAMVDAYLTAMLPNAQLSELHRDMARKLMTILLAAADKVDPLRQHHGCDEPS